MINSLSIENFKCFGRLRLDLRPLTLLTGYNGGGKSSFIQPVLLLSQALNGQARQDLPLNGPLARLGTVADVVGRGSPMFDVYCDDSHVHWRFSAKAGTRGLTISSAEAEFVGSAPTRITWSKSLWPESSDQLRAPARQSEVFNSLRNLVAISATRPGAMDVQPMPDAPSPVWGDVGVEGQFASFWYDLLVDEELDPSLRVPEERGATMRMQVDAYLSRLFAGAQANVTAIPQASAYALRYRLGDGDWRRPANIGYGLTYAFPIIVALLAAKPGQLIVIDSPEAHLHPSAQSQMGALLAKIGNSGVQLLVETHSDHLLNGVRLSVKNGEIGSEDVAVHFFAGAGPDGHGVTSPRIGPDGNISDWPAGFFDQNEVDLARLAGWA